ncbi:MAG: stage 0 sporulation family protein [Chitinophagales bacterium]
MSCSGCSVAIGAGKPSGCGSNGNCMTGGCNRLNTFDWLADLPVPLEQRFWVHEVSFKNGLRKGFFKNVNRLDLTTGDMVVVSSDSGIDVGKVSLSGELVKLQIKKRRMKLTDEFPAIVRRATDRDIEKLVEARAREGSTMIRARVLARELKLEMKIGEVEFQADNRKATFYYTADDRVDFRELIKIFAQEFKVKIEMRQIGARQEAGKIGGIGSCGRELCCSTWLTDFKSVSTGAARYQNLSINQAKLSGQCGRLKCCLNYELDTYLDALKDFPDKADVIETKSGKNFLVKTDIFRRRMVYEMQGTGKQISLELEKVNELLAKSKKGEIPESLEEFRTLDAVEKEPVFANVIDEIALQTIEKSERKRNNKKKKKKNPNPQNTKTQNTGQQNSNPQNPNPQKKHQPNRNQQKRRPNTNNRNNNHRNNNKDNNNRQGPTNTPE